MEVLGRGRGVGDSHVALGCEGEESLHPGTRVLGSGTLVTVREQQGEAGRQPPLRLARSDEGVDDHLARVGEVAELGLPEDHRVGVRRAVAVLESEAAGLGEWAVVELERGFGLGQVLDRGEALTGLLVVEDEVALGEGPAFGVLPGQAKVYPFLEQRGEGECFGLGEVDPVRVECLGPFREWLSQLALDGEPVRNLDQRLVDGSQPFLGHSGGHRRASRAIQLAGPGRSHGRILVDAGIHLVPELLEGRLESLPPLTGYGLDLLG